MKDTMSYSIAERSNVKSIQEKKAMSIINEKNFIGEIIFVDNFSVWYLWWKKYRYVILVGVCFSLSSRIEQKSQSSGNSKSSFPLCSLKQIFDFFSNFMDEWIKPDGHEREVEDCHDNQDDDLIENGDYNNEVEEELLVSGQNVLSLFSFQYFYST